MKKIIKFLPILLIAITFFVIFPSISNAQFTNCNSGLNFWSCANCGAQSVSCGSVQPGSCSTVSIGGGMCQDTCTCAQLVIIGNSLTTCGGYQADWCQYGSSGCTETYPSGGPMSFSPYPCGGGGGGTPPVLCGNGTLDSGEQCDDGNNSSGDGCSSICQIEGGGGDFAIAITPVTRSVVKGYSTFYNVDLTRLSGAPVVTLSHTGCPPGATCTFAGGNTADLSGGNVTKTLTVVTGVTTPVNSYTITVTGVSGPLTRSASTNLNVTLGVNNSLCGGIVSANSVNSGQPFAATVNMWNTGTSIWESSVVNPTSPHQLMPLNAIWGNAKIDPPVNYAGPGAQYGFAVNTVSPLDPAAAGCTPAGGNNYTCQMDYRMVQSGVQFGSASCSKNINVVFTPPPAVTDIKANASDGPINIPYNTSANLSWTYSNATNGSCSITAPGTIGGYPAGNGNVSTGNLVVGRTYTISCSPAGANSSDSVQVNVNAALNFSITLVKGGQGTVRSNPAGINCGASCSNQSANFTQNTTVQLTATPIPGRLFTGWGGDCAASGRNPQCDVYVDGDKNVIANFAVDPNYKEF